MSDQITLGPEAAAVLNTLQRLFAPHASVTTVQTNSPAIIKEFSLGVIADPIFARPPKPAMGFIFATECGMTNNSARTCALIFTEAHRLAQFCASNPRLNQTLISCWHGAATVWLQVTGRIPPDFAADGLHLCSSGTVPVGCPEHHPDQFILQSGEITLIDFSQLVWSEPQQEEIDRLFLEMEIGPPFRIGARGRRLLNTAYWSKFIIRLIPITYDMDRQSLVWSDPANGKPIWRSEDDSLRMLSELMQVAARRCPDKFPEGELRPARMRQILERIKLLAKPSRASGEVLDRFLETQTVRTPDKDITSSEFRDGYVAYCRGLGRTPCAASRFYRTLRAKLRGMGIDQRHDILRNGKMVRGYGGLGLKVIQVSDASGTSDVSDGA